ncbi:hypothetical protein [Lachnoclostridium phytofermentans]|uniref:hypothetical protein n=1 Tax=Lachnoclostridium phytofermentans TaxID=66219 RepID=UPI000494FA4A|nr:hypothetical protein [Lachnoclostridium phytofermentans]
MKRITSSKKFIYRIFILLFMIDISFSVIPSGIIQSYGLFGELTSNVAVEKQERSILSKSIKYSIKKRYKPKPVREQMKLEYEWLLLVIIIILIKYLMSGVILSKVKTPVVMRVRMNN